MFKKNLLVFLEGGKEDASYGFPRLVRGVGLLQKGTVLAVAKEELKRDQRGGLSGNHQEVVRRMKGKAKA